MSELEKNITDIDKFFDIRNLYKLLYSDEELVRISNPSSNF